MKRQAFTLIELLMTVAIVVVLAGILVPAVMNGIKKGQQAKAKAEIVTLVNAIKQYENTYNRLPVTNTKIDDEFIYKARMDQCQPVHEDLINALQGSNSIKNQSGNAVNPRQTPFLERRNTGAGDYQDPWGNPYRIILNADEDIRLTTLFKGTLVDAKKHYAEDDHIYQSVIIWSAGPDGNFDTKDDVHSFEAEYEAGKWHVTN